MPTRADFSAELTLVCNSLDAGGIERVARPADAARREVRAQLSPSPAHP